MTLGVRTCCGPRGHTRESNRSNTA